VSEQPTTEDAGRLDSATLHALLEFAPDALIVVNEAGAIELVNAQVEELFGYKRPDLLGRPVELLVPEDLRDRHRGHRADFAATPGTRPMGVDLVLQGRRRDGSLFPVEIALSPLATASGPLVVAAVRDISQRLAAESANLLLSAAIDSVSDGAFVFDAESLRFVHVNAGAVRQVGYSRKELLGGMTPLDLLDGADAERFAEMLRPLRHGLVESLTFSTTHRHRDGSFVPVEIVVQAPAGLAPPPGPLPATGGLIIAMARDVTERRKAEEALRASEESFRLAFEDAPVGMCLVDLSDGADRRVVRANQALADLLGYETAEIEGRTLAELTHPEDRERDEQAACAMLEGSQTVYETEKRYLRADGSILWARLDATRMDSGDGRTFSLAHIIDIGRRKAAEAERDLRERWLTALGDVRLSLLGGTTTSGLQLICDRVAELAGFDFVAVMLLGDDPLTLTMEASNGDSTYDGLTLALDEGSLCQTAMRSGEPVYSPDAASDERVPAANRAATARLGPVMIAPVGEQRSPAGVLVAARRSGGPPLTPTMDRTVRAFAAEATLTLRMAEARDDEQRLVVLEDRERIAQDLHDMVIQRLFAAGMGLEAVTPLVRDERVAERLARTVNELDTTIAEIRSTIYGLMSPLRPADDSLRAQLDEMLDSRAAQLGFRPQLAVSGELSAVPVEVAEHLLPALNEALANVARHARATRVEIDLEVTADAVVAVVRDDGIGIPDDPQRGNGLDNMARRALRLGGSCQVARGEAGGTLMSWQVPLVAPVEPA